MALTIYEVVAGGDGEDWSVLVAAHNPTEARDIVGAETKIGRPWVIYEWGTDARAKATPGILRGPFQDYPAYGRGWKMWQEDWHSQETPKPIVEWKIE